MHRTIVIFLILTSSVVVRSQTKLNRNWWMDKSPDFRAGVISGALDCLKYDRGADVPTLTVPVWNDQVNAAFQRSKTATTLADILLSVRTKNKPQALGGEDYSKEKYGSDDEYYWGVAHDDERLGFVIGYLSCGTTLPFSPLRAKEYRDKIDSWFDKHPSSSAKVPDVITKIQARSKKKNCKIAATSEAHR